MNSPFNWIPANYLWIVLSGFALITLFVGYQLAVQDKRLQTKEVPNGILAIEVPWTTERAEQIVKWWGEEGKEVARKQVLWDFVFLVLYPVTLSLCCVLLSGLVPAKLGLVGIMVAWGVLLAGPLDALENIAMLKMLSGAAGPPFPQLATIFAAIKFTLVFGALGYMGVAGAWALVLRIKGA